MIDFAGNWIEIIIGAISFLGGAFAAFKIQSARVERAETEKRIAEESFKAANDAAKRLEKFANEVQQNADEIAKTIEQAKKDGAAGQFDDFTKEDF